MDTAIASSVAALLLAMLLAPRSSADDVHYPQRYLTGFDRLEPWNLIADDFSGDDIPDIAVLHTAGVAFLRNDGAGSFEESDLVIDDVGPWRNSRRRLVSGDWNADGSLDLAAVFLNREVKIILNLGDGRFEEGSEIMLDGIHSIAAGDLNGDGADDLLLGVCSTSPPLCELSLLISRGDASFTRIPQTLPPGTPEALAVVHHDGGAAVAVGMKADNQDLTVYLAPADLEGNVPAWSTESIFDGWGSDLRAADVDGDGTQELVLLDLFEFSSTRVAVARLDAELTLSVLHEGTAITDAVFVPGAALVAEVTHDALHIVRFDASFQATSMETYSAGGLPQCLAAGDFDNDGSAGIAIGLHGDLQHDETVWGSVTVALSRSDTLQLPRNWAPVGGHIRDMKLKDLDGDADLDAVLALTHRGEQHPASVVVLERDGGTWIERSRQESPHPLGELELADLDEDGILDLVGCESFQDSYGIESLAIFRGKETFHFRNANLVPVGESPVAAAIADVNSDGHLDIVTVLHGCRCFPGNTAALAVLLGTGDEAIDVTLTIPAGQYARDLILADVTGDETLDVVLAHTPASNEPGASLFEGRGDGTFILSDTTEMAAVDTIARGDLDQDGVEELVFAGDGLFVCDIEDGYFAPPQQIKESFRSGPVTIGDVTGDGIPDILAADTDPALPVQDKILVFRGHADGTFSEEEPFRSGLGAADLRVTPLAPGEATILAVAGSIYEHRSSFFVSLPVSVDQTVPFVRGDANDDGTTDLSDGVFVLNFLFLGGVRPACLQSADADDSGVLEITDAVFLLNFLFLGGSPLSPPHPECAKGTEGATLRCDAFESC